MKALTDLLSPGEGEVWLPGVDLTRRKVRKTPEPHPAVTATHSQETQQTIRLTGRPLQASQVPVLMAKSKLKLRLAARLGRNSPELK